MARSRSAGFLSSAMPTVARLLGMASAADDQRDPGDEDPLDPPADDPPADDPPADDPPPDDPEADDPPAAAASLANLSSGDRTQLIAAFERDAAALVSAERDRCISVFTSEAGRRNADGAAAVLRDTDMTAERAAAFLGTCVGNRRTDARERLNADGSTRVATGGGREATGEATEAVTEHRKRQKQRNKGVKGGKAVNAETADAVA